MLLAGTTSCQARAVGELKSGYRYNILREQEDFSFLNPDSLRTYPVWPDSKHI